MIKDFEKLLYDVFKNKINFSTFQSVKFSKIFIKKQPCSDKSYFIFKKLCYKTDKHVR